MAALGHIVGIIIGALVAELPHIGAFSIHPAPHQVLTTGGSRSFGHQVLPLDGARVLVGAPSEVRDGGRLFQCVVQSGECREVELEGNSTRTHIGMALARDGDGTIACGPGFTHVCDRNMYVSGVCLLLDPQLRLRQELMPGRQGCQRAPVDLVFLFDGSSSMSPSQFGAIRDFMVDVMEKLENTSIHFGAVQFSDGVQPVFTLEEFVAKPRPRELLRGLRQRGGLTDTFAAIGFVVQTLFSERRGARPAARRVLVLITDGDATDSDTESSVRAAEERGIHRYVIGVGNNFNSPNTQLYLQQFASGPGFVQVLKSFEQLQSLFQELQARLYDIEGTTQLHSFHLEMCSSGISVDVIQGRRVTGAVGADNGAGGLLELQENETFVPNPHLNKSGSEGYLGYSVIGLHIPARVLVAAGAPRHLHVGGMVLFEVSRATGDWQVLQTLVGEQVGSYFGATLCTLDQGGVTVALLVGAPSHYDGQRGGRVHVYTWKEDALHPSGELWGASGHPLGRFGASLATLGDLDGDNLPEVAVGAPLEDEECGAVYIFSGCPGGVKPFPRQRLQGKVVALGRFFGQAVAGGLDLTGDGLVDMAVGMEGHVVVMRSRPVLRVTPHLTFEPPVIPTRWVDCSNVTASTVTFRLCLRPPGDLVTPVTFQADVDPQRAQGRGHFGEGQQSWAGEMQPGQSCQQEALRVLPCLEDFVTPIRVTVTITLPHRDPPGHILHPSSAPPTWAEIPFEQNCGADEVCEADLGVKVVPRGAAVLGVPSAELGVLLIVKNRGEDAYGVALQVNHLLGVSFRRARASQASTLVPMPIHCWDSQGFEGQPWGLTCNLSCPVLRSGWQVLVEVTFDLQQNASWGQSLGLTATVSSNNEPNITLGDNTDSWDIPVHFALDLVASWQEDSTHHLNFTPPQPHNKTVQHHYQVELLWPPPQGSPKPQVTPFVLLPHVLPHGVAMAASQVRVEPGSPCVAVELELGDSVGQELNRSIAQACSTPHLQLFRCPPTLLTPANPARITVSAVLQPLPHSQGPAHSQFCSALWLTLPLPLLAAAPQLLRAQGVTKVELLWEVDPLPVYMGGGVGGLLLLLLISLGLAKCGFFRRNYRERMEQEGEREGEEEEEGGGQWEGEGSPPSGETPEGGDPPS